MFQEIKTSLRQLYLEDKQSWLVGFSGDVGPSSARPGPKALRPYNDAVLSIPAEQRKKPLSVLCTDTRVEIPAIAEMIEGTLDRRPKCSEQHSLNIDANNVAPAFRSAHAGLKAGATIEESFWVNIIGRGYPPPNRTFRWCTQRMKIDPVNALVKERVGIRCSGDLQSPTGGRRPPPQTGARRAESSTRAQTMAAPQTRNGLRRHPDLPRVWVSNPIEYLTTEDVWAYLLQKPNPWGGDFTLVVGPNGIRPRPSAARPYTPAPATASAPSRRSSCTRCVKVVVRGDIDDQPGYRNANRVRGEGIAALPAAHFAREAPLGNSGPDYGFRRKTAGLG